MANYNSNSGSRFIDGIVVGGEVYAESNIYLPEADTNQFGVLNKGQIYFGDRGTGAYDFKIGTTTDNTNGGIIEAGAAAPIYIQTGGDNDAVYITTDASNADGNGDFIASFSKGHGVKLGYKGYHALETAQRPASYTFNNNNIPYPLGINVVGSFPGEDYEYTLDSFVETGSVTFATGNTSGYKAQIGLRNNTTIPHTYITADDSTFVDDSRSLNFNIDNGPDKHNAYFSWSTSSSDYSTVFVTDNTNNNIDDGVLKTDIMRLYEAPVVEGSTLTGVVLDIGYYDNHPNSPSRWRTNLGVIDSYPDASPTAIVKADLFEGQADTVKALNNAAGTLNTDDLAEGSTNLYFLDTRARNAISLTTGDPAEGGSLSYVNGAFTFNPVAESAYTVTLGEEMATVDYTKGIASFKAGDFSLTDGHVELTTLIDSHIGTNADIQLSKLENISNDRLLGNVAGDTGDVAELTPGNVRTLLNVEDGADNYGSFNIYSGKAGYYEDSDKFIGVNSDVALHLNEELESLQATSGTDMIFVPGGGIEISTALVQHEGNEDTILIGINTSATDTTYTGNGEYGITIEEEIDIRLKDDRRRNSDNARVMTGNTSEYIAFNPLPLDLTDIDYLNPEANPIIDSIQFFTNKAEEMRLLKSGDLHVNGDIVGFSNTISDERLKENIKTVDNALDKVSQLNGVTFDWERNGAASAGLIAQDLEAVLPSAVKEQPLPLHAGNEIYKTVEYSQVTALLVEAIKELKEQNAQLRADIEELKNINTSK